MRVSESRLHKLRIPVGICLIVRWHKRLEACGAFECHIVKLAILFCIGQLHDICRNLYTCVTVVCYSDMARLSFLGCHDDDTVSRTHTIDSSCRSIFEDCERLDIATGEEVDIVHECTIDNIKRIGIVSDGTDTTDLYRWACSRSTALSDLNTTDHTGECRHRIGSSLFCKCITLYIYDRCGKVLGLLCTVTYHNNLFHHEGVRLKSYIHLRLWRQCLGKITHESKLEHTTLRCSDLEVTVKVSKSTVGCTLNEYVGAGQRPAVLIENRSLDVDCLLSENR